MPKPNRWLIRSAQRRDRDALSRMLASARWQHHHLDWMDPLDMLEARPFLILEERGSPVGCLACPPEPEGVVWLRLFALAAGKSPDQVWQRLWPVAAKQALEKGAKYAAVLAVGDWLAHLLVGAGFEEWSQVIFLERQSKSVPTAPAKPCILRPMLPSDLPQVAEIEKRSFGLIWRNSIQLVEKALAQVSYASVAEHHGELVGYQMSTVSALGGHLARLAVAPEWQRQGLGRALACDALARWAENGIYRVTVNTQSDNFRSLELYSKLDFRRTGRHFPVYLKEIGGL